MGSPIRNKRFSKRQGSRAWERENSMTRAETTTIRYRTRRSWRFDKRELFSLVKPPWYRPPASLPLQAFLMLSTYETEIRVRYHETDGQGVVHHGNYAYYFELGRTELLRASGRGYETLEAEGIQLVVADLSIRYLRPARFGDVIRLRTTTTEIRGARVLHAYQAYVDDTLIVEGTTTVACIGPTGKVQRLPSWLTE